MAEHFYFTSLELSGIRCFGPETQRLVLSDNDGRPSMWNVLLGDNGTGKTTVLQCMAAASRSATDTKSRHPKTITLLWMMVAGDIPAKLKATACFSSAISGAHALTKLEADGDSVGFESGIPGEVFLAAYGAKRRYAYGQPSGDSTWYDDVVTMFEDEAPLVSPQSWLLGAELAALKAGEASALLRFERIRRVLLDVLPEVYGIRSSVPDSDPTSPRLEFKTPFGWIQVDRLGLGYRTLIAWMVDFAKRMLAWYPQSENPLAEPAICLVDEIDLHLHPKWQRQLVSHLREHFPKTQFIVTAHSPLIVQASGDGNIALLRREKGTEEREYVVINNDLDRIKNWRVDQILTSELYGLPSARPPHLDALLKERRGLLSKKELTEEDRLRGRQLDEEIGALPGGEDFDSARKMEEMLEIADSILESAKKR